MRKETFHKLKLGDYVIRKNYNYLYKIIESSHPTIPNKHKYHKLICLTNQENFHRYMYMSDTHFFNRVKQKDLIKAL